MRQLLIILLVFFWVWVVSTFFGERAFAGDWSTQDTVIQSVVLISFELDRRQTLLIKNYPQSYEINPILGKHPSDTGVNNYFVLCALVHTGIAYLLPQDARAIFQLFTVAIEVGVISNNYSLGLRVTI